MYEIRSQTKDTQKKKNDFVFIPGGGRCLMCQDIANVDEVQKITNKEHFTHFTVRNISVTVAVIICNFESYCKM